LEEIFRHKVFKMLLSKERGDVGKAPAKAGMEWVVRLRLSSAEVKSTTE